MNVRDSEVIAGLLTTTDYRLTTNAEEADIVIFNTCSVRQHAEDKVWSEIGRLAKLSPPDSVHKAHRIKAGGIPRPTKIVGLVGCMAQNYKDGIFKRAPSVDFVVGPSDIEKIPRIIKRLQDTRRMTEDASHTTQDTGLFEYKIWETNGSIRSEDIYHTGFYENKEHAYVVISEGCSNYCSYCVVPYVRGELRNRNPKDILREINEAVNNGITHVTLLGQNVNAYEYEGVNFVKLVGLVNLVKGLKEFSFITSHPKDTSTGLFEAMRDLDKLKKYLHLPVQSGSDKILKLMNRGYARKFYLDLIDNYRKIVKDGVLTTDIIVGFPTETEGDFQDTYKLVEDIQFDAAFIFKYSPRPHTQAANLPDDVPKQEKERRHALILELQKKISKKINEK
jgi:tRNA-2-methylthio-N6-dimethylallyladenosine synthase